MQVSEILATVRPAYGGTWEGVLEYFRSTPHEWRRVEELVEEISKVGLQKPGRVDFHEAYTGPDATKEDLEEYLFLGNGTHRFVAAQLFGLEEFPVVFESEDEPNDPLFYRMTEVELWVKFSMEELDREAASKLEDSLLDCFSSSLSFRVNDEVWAECGGQSSTRVRSGRRYELSFFPIPPEHTRAFAEKFLKRVACCVRPEMVEYFSVHQSTHFEEDYWREHLE